MSRIRVNPAIIINYDNDDSSNIVVGDLVTFSTSTQNAVVRADADDPTKMPVIGLVRRVSATKVSVQMDHAYTFASNHGFTTGDEIYAHPTQPGKLTSTRPTGTSFSDNTGFIQKIGYATNNTNKILIKIDQAGQDISIVDVSGEKVVVTLVTDEALALGDVVRIAEGGGDGSTAGRAKKSITSDNKSDVVGITTETVGSAGSNIKVQVQGIATISFNPSLTSADLGKICYLGSVSGRATVTVPSSGSLIELGRVITQSSSTGTVLLKINTILHRL